MNQEITDKIYILVLRGNVRLWLNRNEFEAIKKSISQEISFIEINGKIISKDAILYLVPRNEIEDADKIKKGEWKCEKHNNWLARGIQCGHC